MTTQTALISVSDKSGIVDFASALAQRGIALLSTGGTARLLREAGLEVTEVAAHTRFPEILDGRVKTLHPRIHGGLLARRDDAAHLRTLAEHDIPTIDLLVVNLYPFGQTVARPDCTLAEAIENIDIGGPAMLRSAAKNHGGPGGGVSVVIDPADYARVLADLDGPGHRVSYALRLELAAKAFAHTAAYDGAIANWLASLTEAEPAPEQVPAREPWPRVLSFQWQRQQVLRYGENPHQGAAFYRDPAVGAGLLASYRQIQGKALSYNNIADTDTAWESVRHFATPACVIVKHANPCGAALGGSALEAYEKAFRTDPTSAFGGIVAFNTTVDEAAARAVSGPFLEVLVAPAYTGAALAILSAKKNVRVLEIPLGPAHNDFDVKRVGGGWLVQDGDLHTADPAAIQVVTRQAPSPEQMQDLLFAWHVARYVKSNAIVFCGAQATLGVGAGQMSRVDSARIASIKATQAGLDLQGSVVASDAFFPFRDGLDVVADAGATCVIQPGGSIRDDEVIAAANERGVAMVFTGFRHFRH
ncbi:bifunctional phosphoribosylaminoimidazolecarboxamide formyltransferase/IMP cyclohydrolase [Castellaniella sp.]|uniref:bifunctional phosphoribosylaminoimidazolecarboxamide formyltransferase/IMP cyclohydrolase n=1 Tax=Castellaniella sp. TaxID=1955812 RepID=UPI00356ACECB